LTKTTGFGAFLHPPSLFYYEGKREQPKLLAVKGRKKPQSSGPNYEIIEDPVKRKIACDYTSEDDFQVLVTEDGFVGVITASKKKAFDYLNVLFATLNTKFCRARYITPKDLVLFFWEEPNKFLEINLQRTFSLRNLFELKRDSEESFPDWERWPRQEIGTLFMRNMLGFSYRFYKNENIKTDLQLIGEASGMYFDGHFSSGFLSSWIVVESILERLWQDYVATLERTKDERNALKNPNSWSVNNFIEVFSFLGKLDEDNRKCLSKLRKLRNDIVHKKKRNVTHEEVWNCLNVAICMVYNQLNQTNPFEDVKYTKQKIVDDSITFEKL